MKGRGIPDELETDDERAAHGTLPSQTEASLLRQSNHGSEHCSGDYRVLQAEYGMATSMRRKGNCRSNVPMRSSFNSLKNERALRGNYVRKEEARQDLFDYIEVFYSRRRPPPALHYKNPAQHHAAWLLE